MKRFWLLLLTFVFLMGCATTGQVKEGENTKGPTLLSLDVKESDGITEVMIQSSSPLTYTVYKPDDPFKVYVDLSGASLGRINDKMLIDKGGIVEIVPKEVEGHPGTSRLEITLSNPMDFTPQQEGNTLILQAKATPGQAMSGQQDTDVKAKNAIEEDKTSSETEAKPEVVTATEVKETSSADSMVKESPEEPKTDAAATVKAEEKPQAEQKAASATSVDSAEKAVAQATEINAIDVSRQQGNVTVTIVGNGMMSPRVFPLKGNRVVIDVPDVRYMAKTPSVYEEPIKAIRIGRYPDKVRIVLDLTKQSSFVTKSNDDKIAIAIQTAPLYEAKKAAEPEKEVAVAEKPETEAAAPVKEEPVKQPESGLSERIMAGKYTGKKISLDFQDADIVHIFRLIADVSGYNIIVNPDVKGKATMKLLNVPWDQALDILLKTYNLGMNVEGNVIRIAPTATFAKEQEELAKMKASQVKAGELITRIIPVNYSDLGMVEKAIKDAKVLTARGNVSTDTRMSSIIVKDIEPSVAAVEKLVKELDQPTRQVMIEARIVEANTSFVREFGVQWGTFFKSPQYRSNLGGTPLSAGTGSSGNPFIVNLPAAVGQGAGGAVGFGYMNAAQTFALDLQLSAMENNGQGKVISSPKVMTMDNQEATIKQGKQFNVVTVTADRIATQSIEALLELTVKPHIAPDNSIQMKITAKKDEPDMTSPLVGGTPPIDRKNISTQVFVKDGETIVIGGIFRSAKSTSEAGIPGLMRIPILRWLFGKQKVSTDTSELLIFITPRVVKTVGQEAKPVVLD